MSKLKKDMCLEEDMEVIRERVRKMAELVVNEGYTTRRLATLFRISRTTAHKYITVRLEKIDSTLYDEVKEKLAYNKSVRHLRGGMATMKKYKGDQSSEQHNGL